MPFQLAAAESTDLFIGTRAAPRQVLRATVSRTLVEPIGLTVHGDGVTGAAVVPAGVGVVVVEVGLDLPDVPAGSTLPVTVAVGESRLDTTVTVERPGYTVHLVSHFHYDPVWWNTHAAFTSAVGVGRRRAPARSGSGTVSLSSTRTSTSRCAIRTTGSSSPRSTTSSRTSTPTPSARATCAACSREGRVELVGGTYTEPSTNLSGRRDDDPQHRLRDRVPARHPRRRPADRVAARRLRPRPAVPRATSPTRG